MEYNFQLFERLILGHNDNNLELKEDEEKLPNKTSPLLVVLYKVEFKKLHQSSILKKIRMTSNWMTRIL